MILDNETFLEIAVQLETGTEHATSAMNECVALVEENRNVTDQRAIALIHALIEVMLSLHSVGTIIKAVYTANQPDPKVEVGSA